MAGMAPRFRPYMRRGRLTTWRRGQTLHDSYPVLLPASLPPADYAVSAGMYSWPSVQRLPVSVDGRQVGDSAALGTITVLP